MLSDREGFLIPHDSNEVDHYVEALSRLIAEPALLTRMGQAARRRIAERFTTDQGIEALLSAISNAHQLSATLPRQTPPPGFALETATVAIEYARLTTRAIAAPRLLRLLTILRRKNRLGYLLVENWLTKTIVKVFGHTTLMRRLRGR